MSAAGPEADGPGLARAAHEPSPPRCSVIILVGGRPSATRLWLTTLLEAGGGSGDLEVVVVEDGPPEPSADVRIELSDHVKVVRRSTARGFAAACNDGVTVSSGEYVAFLDTRAVPHTGWLETLVAYADVSPRAAVVGSKLVSSDDRVLHAGIVISHDATPRHVYARFPSDHAAVNRSGRVQAVTATGALFHRAAFEDVGGFDSAYRADYGDVDLCLRLGERGYEVHYCHRGVLRYATTASPPSSPSDRDHDERLYLGRWAHRVRPDDLGRYQEDGLLSVSYGAGYPIRLAASPALAVVADEGEDEQPPAPRRESESVETAADTADDVTASVSPSVGLAPHEADPSDLDLATLLTGLADRSRAARRRIERATRSVALAEGLLAHLPESSDPIAPSQAE